MQQNAIYALLEYDHVDLLINTSIHFITYHDIEHINLAQFSNNSALFHRHLRCFRAGLDSIHLLIIVYICT